MTGCWLHVQHAHAGTERPRDRRTPETPPAWEYK